MCVCVCVLGGWDVVPEMSSTFWHAKMANACRSACHCTPPLAQPPPHPPTRRRYAADHSLAVVVSNQVMDSVEPRGAGPGLGASRGGMARSEAKLVGHTGGLRLVSGGREVIPALGLAWANCVNTRVFMGRLTYGASATPAVWEGPPSAAAAAAAGIGRGGASALPVLRKMQVGEREVAGACCIRSAQCWVVGLSVPCAPTAALPRHRCWARCSRQCAGYRDCAPAPAADCVEPPPAAWGLLLCG